MFRFASSRTVRWPVCISVPVDGGRCESAEITVHYRLLNREEARSVADRPRISDQVMHDHVIGWEGIADESGAPIDYSPDALNALLAVPYIERALAVGLVQASSGAPAKNSGAGSDG